MSRAGDLPKERGSFEETVPLSDLRRLDRHVLETIRQAVSSVIDSGWYVHGVEHEAFQKEFAAYCGADLCIGVANGTDAIEIALRSVGVRPGDQVVTVANAGFYTSTAARAIGAVPVYVDIDATLNMSVESLDRTLRETPGVKAVVLTHLYGQLANVTEIKGITDRHGIVLVEDCAQAHGAVFDGRKAGSFGQVASFSFYPTKNLGCMGDGGAVVTSDPEIAERAKRYSQYGWGKKYEVIEAGGRNSRLDEMQAAVLRVKLRSLDAWNARRRQIVKAYVEASAANRIVWPHDPASSSYVGHLCIAIPPDRDAFVEHMRSYGIATAVHYPISDFDQPAYLAQFERRPELPMTDQAIRTIVTLPCFPELTDQEVDRVCQALAKISS
ncbi:aminotransferase class I/II-fold pyridoxal phosphate-dependent enzyme [bacterium]|nr:aminotransferase class I/II-fold pyridoxal phosphate-dependent enzyme [bacterium]